MTIRRYFDKQYNFAEIFNDKSGMYLRTAILDEYGKETKKEAFMRSFPSLLDIGIMGKCSSSNTCAVGCYQQGSGNKLGKNMLLDDYMNIIDEVSGRVFEVALGGFGNPNEHENFYEIMSYTRQKGIVPNYTTAGNNLSDFQIEITRDFAGAVAVSYHSRLYTFDAIERFVDAGCKTNIHYVLGNDSIDDAIEKLENNSFPDGINAVIFLLYKPVGKIKDNNILNSSDPRVKRFYELIDIKHPFKCGLDSCHIPGVMNFTKNVLEESISPCDAARFSMYITPDGYALPCSFDTTNRKYAVDIKKGGIEMAWNSPIFDMFREHHKDSCGACLLRKNCFGGCPLMGEKINLCERIERDYILGKE